MRVLDGAGDVLRWRADAVALYGEILERVLDSEGHRGGEFYTPRSLVHLMVDLVEPSAKDRILDPSCGTGGLLAAAADRAVPAGGREEAAPPRATGQALGERARYLAAMNLLLHGHLADVRIGALEALDHGPRSDDRYDVVITNPPFNLALGGRDGGGAHLPYGPTRNAVFAWLQHAVAVLSARGRAAVLTPRGATFRTQRAERSIRTAMVENGVIDCVIDLPPNLFASTAIPVSLWILRRGGSATDGLLLIDASRLGEARSRTVRKLGDDDLRKITETYRGWRGGRFEGERGFARRADLEMIRAHDHSLSPRLYVGSDVVPIDTASAEDGVLRHWDDLQRLRVCAARIDDELGKRLWGEA
ncbi:N-6 DNA methylase [Actinomadura sp. 7K507]|uniref:N-6 DNA methylase n=1 Tax=Actinomadura sp. 7K507 TaxID=2530365 RepID=UPI0014053C79|nr:N-6 DNA methylase [Actinomadura sp. 7K507]